jgi:hypothetical protein
MHMYTCIYTHCRGVGVEGSCTHTHVARGRGGRLDFIIMPTAEILVLIHTLINKARTCM